MVFLGSVIVAQSAQPLTGQTNISTSDLNAGTNFAPASVSLPDLSGVGNGVWNDETAQSFSFAAFANDGLFIPIDNRPFVTASAIIDLTVSGGDVSDLVEPVTLCLSNIVS